MKAHIRVAEALCLAHAPSQPLLLDLVPTAALAASLARRPSSGLGL
jgi:hypothetical protein